MAPEEMAAAAATIAPLTDDGLTASEIGERLDLTEQRVRRIATRFKVRLQPPGGRVRRVAVPIPTPSYVTIRNLAQTAHVTPVVMLTRIAVVALEDRATTQGPLEQE